MLASQSQGTRRRLFSAACLTISALLCLQGCATATPPTQPTEPTEPTPSTQPTAGELGGDIDAELRDLAIRSPEVRRSVADAVVQCLEHAGVDSEGYLALFETTENLRDTGYIDSPRSYSGLLPVLTVANARTSGYTSVLRPRLVDTSGALELPHEVSDAMVDEGSPMVSIDIPGFGVVEAYSGGCSADAYESVYGSVRAWLLADQFAPAGLSQFSVLALDSAEVEAVAVAYASCMAQAGYETANPAVAADVARERWRVGATGQHEVSTDEVEMAIADATCQRSHPVLETVEAVTLELADSWLKENRTAIAQAAEAQRTALARSGHNY